MTANNGNTLIVGGDKGRYVGVLAFTKNGGISAHYRLVLSTSSSARLGAPEGQRSPMLEEY